MYETLEKERKNLIKMLDDIHELKNATNELQKETLEAKEEHRMRTTRMDSSVFLLIMSVIISAIAFLIHSFTT